jgi:biotin transport system substrate-specific component
MAHAPSSTISFVDALWPAQGAGRLARAVLLALVGSALLTLSAKLQVPFYPVPMTMQTLVALLIGLAYGFPLGLATVLLYLAEGAAGLPVFAGTPEKGIGLAYMAGPTGGYLVGFALAAAITGWIAERRRDIGALALAVIAGSVAIYAPGVLWLSTFPDPGTGAPMGLEKALLLGAAPFVLGDLVKAALALALGVAGAEWLRRRAGN